MQTNGIELNIFFRFCQSHGLSNLFTSYLNLFVIWNFVTLHLYFVSKAYTAVFNWGEKSVFFETMKRLLVWKPKNLNRFPCYYFWNIVSAVLLWNPSLTPFFKKIIIIFLKIKTPHLALDYLISFESLKYKWYQKQQAEV